MDAEIESFVRDEHAAGEEGDDPGIAELFEEVPEGGSGMGLDELSGGEEEARVEVSVAQEKKTYEEG